MIFGWTAIALVLALIAGHTADAPATPREQQHVIDALHGGPGHGSRANKRPGSLASTSHRSTARPHATPVPRLSAVARRWMFDLVVTAFADSQSDRCVGHVARSRAPPLHA